MEADDQPPADESEAKPAISQAQSSSSSPSTITNTATASTTRSYECTFCKRGFSNAQALGGHMNIHRKERHAKPKQPFSAHAHFPFDITPPGFPTSSSYMPVPQPRGFVFDQPPWAASPSPSPRDVREGPRQLPLFVERPSTSTDCDGASTAGIGSREDVETEKIEQTEIDLELRLGP